MLSTPTSVLTAVLVQAFAPARLSLPSNFSIFRSIKKNLSEKDRFFFMMYQIYSLPICIFVLRGFRLIGSIFLMSGIGFWLRKRTSFSPSRSKRTTCSVESTFFMRCSVALRSAKFCSMRLSSRRIILRYTLYVFSYCFASSPNVVRRWSVQAFARSSAVWSVCADSVATNSRAINVKMLSFFISVLFCKT